MHLQKSRMVRDNHRVPSSISRHQWRAQRLSMIAARLNLNFILQSSAHLPLLAMRARSVIHAATIASLRLGFGYIAAIYSAKLVVSGTSRALEPFPAAVALGLHASVASKTLIGEQLQIQACSIVTGLRHYCR